MNKKNYRRVGSIEVESGMVIVGDPAYLPEWDNNADVEFNTYADRAGDYSYLGAAEAALSPHNAGILGDGKAIALTARRPLGNTTYPVFAQYDDQGQIISITIDIVDQDQ